MLVMLLLLTVTVIWPASALVWDTLTFGNLTSESKHQLTTVGRTSAVASGSQPHRSIALNSTVTFVMRVDLDSPAQFLSVRFSGDQWQNSSDIRALWLLDPLTGRPWPNTAPGGAPPSGSHSNMGSGGPLTHLDLVWGENAPYANGWQVMTTVLPPGLVYRARAAGYSGQTKLNFTFGAIIWTDLYGHKITKPSRDVYEVFTSDDAFFELQGLPASVEVEIEAGEEISPSNEYTRHLLQPTSEERLNYTRSLEKAGEMACESACNALKCCQGFTRNPTTTPQQSPGDGSCWLYCGLSALTASQPQRYHSNITCQSIWLQKQSLPMPPVVGPPLPPPPPRPLTDEKYLQARATKDITTARAAQNFGNSLSFAMPAWVVGSVDGGACRRLGARCNDTAWRQALAADSVDHGSYMRQIELIARAGAIAESDQSSSLQWLPSNLTSDWVARSIAACDFWVRSQGANGGWTRPVPPGATDSNPEWIGAPHRQNATGGMEGVTTAAIGKTFLLLAHSNKLSEAVLAEGIDDDCDSSTPLVSRRNAYESMFRRGVRFWLDSRNAPFSADPALPRYYNWGGPGNQGLDNMHSLYLQFLSLQWLQPSVDRPAGIDSSGAKNLLYQGVGLALSEQKGPRGSSCASVTPDGISVEGAVGLNHGGYMEGYGQIAGHQFRVSADLCEHDPSGCDPAMIAQAKRVQLTFSEFRYVQRCRGCGGVDFDCLIAEPHISWRHLLNPGVVDYSDFEVGAAVFGDPTSQRLFELFSEHGVILRTQVAATGISKNCNREPRAPLGAYSQDPTRAFVFTSVYPTLKSRPRAPLLPTERDTERDTPNTPMLTPSASNSASSSTSSAWVDPVSQTFIIRDSLDSLRISSTASALGSGSSSGFGSGSISRSGSDSGAIVARAATVVTLSASMHWRSYTVAPHGSDRCSAFVECSAILSNLTRLHYAVQNSTVDRVATIPATADIPDGLYTSRYGPYFMAVCGYRCQPPHNVVTVPLPWNGTKVSELVSGRTYAAMKSRLPLTMLEAVVLKLEA